MPKIVDHGQRRREIIGVARRLIVEGGFRAATMRSLASDAGYANGALTHYFDGKDAIIEATFDAVLDEITRQDPAPADASITPSERLRALMLAPVATTPDEFAAGRVLLALWDHALESPRLLERYRAHLDAWRSSLVAAMEAARDAGSVRDDVDFDSIADGYISMMMGAAVMHLMYPAGEKVSVFLTFVDDTLAFLAAPSAGLSTNVEIKP